MKVAIIHYWLVAMRGGERVLEAICEMFPDADIFTHVLVPEAISPTIRAHAIHTSFIHRLPAAPRLYRHYLPLMPMALEQLDLSAYDLVISSESGPAKGIVTRPDATHVCYCHSPMRYLWDQQGLYGRAANPVTRLAMIALLPRLRLWDAATALRVDSFVANSHFVAQRIRKVYRRDALVIHPPVRVSEFGPAAPAGSSYLCLGRLVPYKRIDLAIEAFRGLDRQLVIAGDGGDIARLKAMAPPNVAFLGTQTDEGVRELLRTCRALIMPGEEDFGIVPVETLASGRPVIAFNGGGARETIRDGRTGILFDEQSATGLRAAILRFEAQEAAFDPDMLRAHAEQFDVARFKAAFGSHIAACIASSRYDPIASVA